jgi:hypothetical protein
MVSPIPVEKKKCRVQFSIEKRTSKSLLKLYQVKKAQTIPQTSLMHQNLFEQHRLWLSTSLGLKSRSTG